MFIVTHAHLDKNMERFSDTPRSHINLLLGAVFPTPSITFDENNLLFVPVENRSETTSLPPSSPQQLFCFVLFFLIYFFLLFSKAVDAWQRKAAKPFLKDYWLSRMRSLSSFPHILCLQQHNTRNLLLCVSTHVLKKSRKTGSKI